MNTTPQSRPSWNRVVLTALMGFQACCVALGVLNSLAHPSLGQSWLVALMGFGLFLLSLQEIRRHNSGISP